MNDSDTKSKPGDIDISMYRGWMGNLGQVLHYLRTVNADQDRDGRFILAGAEPEVFLGVDLGDATEVVVPGETLFFRSGSPYSLAVGLRSTSYGLGIAVVIH